MSPDTRRLVAAQGFRAAGYGGTAVLLGALLAARDYSTGASPCTDRFLHDHEDFCPTTSVDPSRS
jgi:hypothetical protein